MIRQDKYKTRHLTTDLFKKSGGGEREADWEMNSIMIFQMYGSISDSQHSQWERKSSARIRIFEKARDTGVAVLCNKLVGKPFGYCYQGIFHGK